MRADGHWAVQRETATAVLMLFALCAHWERPP